MKYPRLIATVFASTAVFACDHDADDQPPGATNDPASTTEDPGTAEDVVDLDDSSTGEANAADEDEGESSSDSEEPRVGFEILQGESTNRIVVWLGLDVTQVEFDALELPAGWFMNQPRESVADSGRFLRSPDADTDNVFTDEDHFGSMWRHNATIVETNIPIDEMGLLVGTRVAKYHEVTYLAGRTVPVLVSPQDDAYILVSRDAGRSSETPTIPDAWVLTEVVLNEDLTILLPNPTMNIRCDNEDSFQGPVPELPGMQ